MAPKYMAYREEGPCKENEKLPAYRRSLVDKARGCV